MVGRVVLCNWSPACTVKYRQSTLHATLSLTLTPCKSMQGGLGFQGDSRSFHTGSVNIPSSRPGGPFDFIQERQCCEWLELSSLLSYIDSEDDRFKAM